MNHDRRTTTGATGAPAPHDRRRIALVAGALALASLVAVAVVSNIDTALARFSAATTNEGSWLEAGAIDISTVSNERGVPGEPGDAADDAERAALAIDASGLAPGRIVERCVATNYRGSIDDARIRAFGRRDGGTGLERYLETIVQIGTGADRECADFAAERDVFAGSLGELHDRHDSWANGLTIADSLSNGDSVTMRIAVEVRSDDRAQGLDTEFWLVLEARP